VELARGDALALEALQRLVRDLQVGVQDLQRDLLLQADVLAEVDRAHRALADLALDPVLAVQDAPEQRIAGRAALDRLGAAARAEEESSRVLVPALETARHAGRRFSGLGAGKRSTALENPGRRRSGGPAAGAGSTVARGPCSVRVPRWTGVSGRF